MDEHEELESGPTGSEILGTPEEPVSFSGETPEETERFAAPEAFSAPEEPAASPDESPRWSEAAKAPEERGKKVSPFADSPYVMYDGGAEPPKPSKKPRKKGKGWRAAVAVALVVVLVAAGCGLTALGVSGYWENRMNQTVNTLNQRISKLEQSAGTSGSTIPGNSVSNPEGSLTPGQVYAQNVQSTVAISNQSTTNIYGQIRPTASSGSGFIFSADGYVVTNYHVVEGADSLTVITSDSTEYDATLVGYDEANDLAVLKIDAEGLTPVTIGSSDALNVGDQVAAIGNPLGELTSTLTVGYVSAKDRDVTTDSSQSAINMIQTDAAINPGNSGGPLFNMKGEVIGITTAKYSGTTSSGASIEGIGFAIPIDDVRDMIDDLVELGYISGAYLGVQVRDMDASVAQNYHLPMGAYIAEVTPGYCAEAAGLQAGDIVVDLGGYAVGSLNDLTRALRQFDPGDTTTITVYRGGREMSLTITLSEKPHETDQPATERPMPNEGSLDEWFEYFFGNRG